MNIDENKLAHLETDNGCRPMSVAEAVIGDCHGDEEWLDDVVYYILAYLNRSTAKERVVYINDVSEKKRKAADFNKLADSIAKSWPDQTDIIAWVRAHGEREGENG